MHQPVVSDSDENSAEKDAVEVRQLAKLLELDPDAWVIGAPVRRDVAPGVCEEQLGAGAEISVAVRPEKITISRDAPDARDRNVVKGVVRDLGYFGDQSLYWVLLQSGAVLQVSTQNMRRMASPTVEWDDEVFLSWEVASTILLRT